MSQEPKDPLEKHPEEDGAESSTEETKVEKGGRKLDAPIRAKHRDQNKLERHQAVKATGSLDGLILVESEDEESDDEASLPSPASGSAIFAGLLNEVKVTSSSASPTQQHLPKPSAYSRPTTTVTKTPLPETRPVLQPRDHTRTSVDLCLKQHQTLACDWYFTDLVEKRRWTLQLIDYRRDKQRFINGMQEHEKCDRERMMDLVSKLAKRMFQEIQREADRLHRESDTATIRVPGVSEIEDRLKEMLKKALLDLRRAQGTDSDTDNGRKEESGKKAKMIKENVVEKKKVTAKTAGTSKLAKPMEGQSTTGEKAKKERAAKKAVEQVKPAKKPAVTSKLAKPMKDTETTDDKVTVEKTAAEKKKEAQKAIEVARTAKLMRDQTERMANGKLRAEKITADQARAQRAVNDAILDEKKAAREIARANSWKYAAARMHLRLDEGEMKKLRSIRASARKEAEQNEEAEREEEQRQQELPPKQEDTEESDDGFEAAMMEELGFEAESTNQKTKPKSSKLSVVESAPEKAEVSPPPKERKKRPKIHVRPVIEESSEDEDSVKAAKSSKTTKPVFKLKVTPKPEAVREPVSKTGPTTKKETVAFANHLVAKVAGRKPTTSATDKPSKSEDSKTPPVAPKQPKLDEKTTVEAKKEATSTPGAQAVTKVQKRSLAEYLATKKAREVSASSPASEPKAEKTTESSPPSPDSPGKRKRSSTKETQSASAEEKGEETQDRDTPPPRKKRRATPPTSPTASPCAAAEKDQEEMSTPSLLEERKVTPPTSPKAVEKDEDLEDTPLLSEKRQATPPTSPGAAEEKGEAAQNSPSPSEKRTATPSTSPPTLPGAVEEKGEDKVGTPSESEKRTTTPPTSTGAASVASSTSSMSSKKRKMTSQEEDGEVAASPGGTKRVKRVHNGSESASVQGNGGAVGVETPQVENGEDAESDRSHDSLVDEKGG